MVRNNLPHLKLKSLFRIRNYRNSLITRVENSVPYMVFYFKHFENKLMLFTLSFTINVDRMNKELSSKIIWQYNGILKVKNDGVRKIDFFKCLESSYSKYKTSYVWK